jgi:hypothetical protein
MVHAIALSLLLAAAPGETLGMDDLLRLHEAGVPSDVIVGQLLAAPAVFRPGVDDLVRLREAGISDEVLRALVERQGEPEPPAYRAVPKADGGVLLTNLDPQGRALPTARSASVNVVPRTPLPRPDAAPRRALLRTPLPPGESAAEPEPYVRSSPIGHRWHPSWEEPRTGYPTDARLSGGWGYRHPLSVLPTWGAWGGSGGGYYFLPAAYGPRGPSHFGRFGFYLPGGYRGAIAPVHVRPAP